jgi:hypothetical protein
MDGKREFGRSTCTLNSIKTCDGELFATYKRNINSYIERRRREKERGEEEE